MPKEFVYMWFTGLLTSNKSSEYVAFCVPSNLTYLTILVWVKVDRIVSRLWTDLEINSTHNPILFGAQSYLQNLGTRYQMTLMVHILEMGTQKNLVYVKLLVLSLL